MRSSIRRLAQKGFVGPYYEGLVGRIRFVLHSLIARTELIFVATPSSVGNHGSVSPASVSFKHAATFEELEEVASGLDQAYHEGFVRSCRPQFSWGEEAVVAFLEERPVGIAWIQYGSSTGYPTYYGRLLVTDARILRVGVAPAFRRRGVNTALIEHALRFLFSSGRTQVYIECYSGNIPSARAFLRVGFTVIGAISVIALPGASGFIRWLSNDRVDSMLSDLGLGG